jgi:hypothetical protein
MGTTRIIRTPARPVVGALADDTTARILKDAADTAYESLSRVEDLERRLRAVERVLILRNLAHFAQR